MATDDIFDFGFTAVDEHELESVQKTADKAHDAEDKLNRLYNSILPLLSNLKANPEKDYIYWPNRTAKVEEFEDRLRQIMEYWE